MSLTPELQRLTDALPALAGSDLSFAMNLLAKATRYTLSDKQMYWVAKLADKATAPAPAPIATVTVAPIIDLLNGAMARGLKHPKIRLATPEGEPVVLAILGERSRYAGSVRLTDGAPFGESVYYGRITPDGALIGAGAMTDTVRDLVIAFAADPATMGALIGRRVGACCFCARRLDTTESLAVGYGPVCAEKYGLPWG